MVEMRESFRWHVEVDSTLVWGQQAVKGTLTDLSWKGATVTVSEAALMDSTELAVYFAGDLPRESVTASVVCWSPGDAGGHYRLGMKFLGSAAENRKRLIKTIEQTPPSIDVCFRNTTEFLETLLVQYPWIVECARELSSKGFGDLVQSSFEDLESGRPLDAPEEFRDAIRELPQEDWEVFLLVLKAWADSVGSDETPLTEADIERMADGFLWGNALLAEYLLRDIN